MSCPICFNDGTMATTDCGHSCCTDCMVDFVRASFVDEARPVVHCFACTFVIEPDKAMRLLHGANRPDLCAKIGDRCLSRLMATTADFQYCPACSAPISGCSTTQFWECVCGSTFCVECRKSKAKHGKGAKCTQRFSLRKSEEEKSEKLFLDWQKNESEHSDPIRPCPQCGTGITKNMGCNHITCVCGAEFCYLCLSPYYTPDGDYHFGQPGNMCSSMSWHQFQTDYEYQVSLGVITREEAEAAKAAAATVAKTQLSEAAKVRNFLKRNTVLVALTCPLWVPLSPAIAVAVAGFVAAKSIHRRVTA